MKDVSEAYWLSYEDHELPPDEAVKRAARLRVELGARSDTLAELDARLHALGQTLSAAPRTDTRRRVVDIVRDLANDQRPYSGWKEPAPDLAAQPTVTIPAQEFCDSLLRIAQAIKQGLLDPVTLTWLNAGDNPAPKTLHVVPKLSAKGLDAYDALRTYMT